VPTPVVFVAAAAVAVLILWRGGGLSEIGTSLTAVHPARLGAILLAYSVSILLLGLRWHALTRMAGGAPAWTASAEVFLTSVIVNYAAPIGLAVPTRAALTVRDLGMSPGQSAAVVAWEAALDIVALAVISAGWLALGGVALLQTLPLDERAAALGAVVIVILAATGVVVARAAPIRSRAASFARRMIAGPTQEPGLALTAVVLTAAFWAVQAGIMAALLSIFGAAPTWRLVLGLMGLPVLIGMLSPIPGGAGVREGLMVAAARLEGAAAGPVLLAAIAYRLALFAVTPLVWGVMRLARAWVRRR
jgi:uncharacterized membrane protein YbhN (UPF0104 family)